MDTEQRYILWALPRGETDRLQERPMTSFPLTRDQATTVQAAATRDGWHGFRLVLDDGAVPGFAAVERGWRYLGIR